MIYKKNTPPNPKNLTFVQIYAMTSEQIEKFLEPKHLDKHPVKISFKTRNSFSGIFIQTNDYRDLKSKNFWRIVTETHMKQWRETKDNNLAKIFNGAEFTRLAEGSEN